MRALRGSLTLMLVMVLFTAINIKHDAAAGAWINADWTKTYGGLNSESANCVIQTSDGGYALAGYTYSLGAGSSDFWLIKTDASGSVEWNKTYGKGSSETAYSVVQTGDGGYALAGYTGSFGAGGSDFWLIKTDSLGNWQWNKTYGGSGNDFAYSMVQTIDGGYALAGHTQSQGAGLSDFWLVKTDSLGNAQWSKTYGGASNDIAHSVTRTGDGGYAIAGRTQSFGAGGNDFWLIKTDSLGNTDWSKTYGGTGSDAARSVVQSVDGEYALLGDTQSSGAGGLDFWLIKTNSSGNVKWSKTYGGSVNDTPQSMVQTRDGGYALAGSTLSTGAGSSDFWLVKTDSLGNEQWNKTYGGTGTDYANSMIQTGDGGYALAGHTYSFAIGGSDLWLVKLTPSPIYIRADGSVDPSTAPILRSGDIYTLTDLIYTSALNGIVIERDDMVLDGAGYTLEGTGDNTGILFYGRNNLTIKNLDIRTLSCGIYLTDSTNIVIQANNVTNCQVGIWLVRCTNLAYHNNFVDNNVQVSTLDSVSEWDEGYPSGGNYWNDYDGVDVDGDGIGDSPYVIDADSRDNYPLMTPYPYISGDINRDGTINQLDLEALNKAYGSKPTSSGWSSNTDINNDKIINVLDLRILGKNYGKTTKQ